MKKISDKTLILEDQYQLFLQRMKLNEAKMHPQQKVQLKQAFFGACGQLVILFRDVIGGMETEEEAIKAMESIKNQVGQYWDKEAKRYN